MACLFVEQLSVLDCAYLDAARGLVGESWIVDLELEGALDDQSMVLDFGQVKRRLKQALDASVDHTLLVPRLAPELDFQLSAGVIDLLFRSDLGAFQHRSPSLAVTLLEAAEIDAAAIAAHLQPQLAAVVPPSVTGLRLRLRNEAIADAHYHYVHGLKKHRGQCQRIAHGHRSRIQIRVDGRRDAELEYHVAHSWMDIFLGTREDLVAGGNGRLRFAYDSPEGHFELTLPENRVDILDGDTTVEHIAQHLLQLLLPERPGAMLEVRAYEGVMKGAIARGRG